MKNKSNIVVGFIMIFLIIAPAIVVIISNNLTDDTNGKQNKKTNHSIIPNIKIKNETIDANKEYYCADGFTLSGTTCVYTITTNALSLPTCNNGGYVSGNQCVTLEKEYAKPIWYCITTNELLDEATIEKTCKEKGYPRNILGCPLGYYPDAGNTCSKLVNKYTPAIIDYQCPSDYKLSGTKCVKTSTVDALYKYTCPTGYTLRGLKCIK